MEGKSEIKLYVKLKKYMKKSFFVNAISMTYESLPLLMMITMSG